MKKRIWLLGKKLKKRLEQKKYKSHYINLKKFEKLMCDKYHCGVDDDLFESLNHKEIRHHEALTHICITGMLGAESIIVVPWSKGGRTTSESNK